MNMQIAKSRDRSVRYSYARSCEILMPEEAFIQICGADQKCQRLYEDVEDIDAGSFKYVEPQVG